MSVGSSLDAEMPSICDMIVGTAASMLISLAAARPVWEVWLVEIPKCPYYSLGKLGRLYSVLCEKGRTPVVSVPSNAKSTQKTFSVLCPSMSIQWGISLSSSTTIYLYRCTHRHRPGTTHTACGVNRDIERPSALRHTNSVLLCCFCLIGRPVIHSVSWFVGQNKALTI